MLEKLPALRYGVALGDSRFLEALTNQASQPESKKLPTVQECLRRQSFCMAATMSVLTVWSTMYLLITRRLGTLTCALWMGIRAGFIDRSFRLWGD